MKGDFHDNCIEFYTEDDTATLSLHRKLFQSKIIKLKEKHPDKVDYMINQDGTMIAHVPVSWVKIIPKRELSDECREMMSERARKCFGHDLSNEDSLYKSKCEVS